MRKLRFSLLIFLLASGANAQWQLSNTGISNTGVFSFAQLGTKLFVGTNVGVDVTTNNAASWTNVLSSVGPVTALATDGINLFAGGDGIFLSIDSGANWTPADSGLPTGVIIMSMAISGTNIFAGTDGNGVYLSANNGTSWNPVNNGLSTLNIRNIAVSGTTIFAGTFDGGIFRSTDNGTSWTPINNGIPAGEWVRAFLFNGPDIFAATQDGIYHSINNGDNWAPINSGLPSTDVFSLLRIGSFLLAGTEQSGVYLSSDNGNSWSAFNAGFPSFGIAFALAANATNIFVAMYSDGVYTRPLNQASGISEVGNTNTFLYLNPLNNELIIDNSLQGKFQFTLYNILGEMVAEQYFESSSGAMNLSSFTNGLYCYKIASARNTAASGKFTKR